MFGFFQKRFYIGFLFKIKRNEVPHEPVLPEKDSDIQVGKLQDWRTGQESRLYYRERELNKDYFDFDKTFIAYSDHTNHESVLKRIIKGIIKGTLVIAIGLIVLYYLS